MSRLRVVPLSEVPDERPTVAGRLKITMEQAGILLAAKASLEDGAKLLDGIIRGVVARQRKGSALWRAQLASELLAQEFTDALLATGADEDDAQ